MKTQRISISKGIRSESLAELRRHAPGQREYPRPVYAAGPGVDAERPAKIERKEANRRYREIRGVGVRSIFDLGRIIARMAREESKGASRGGL